MEIIFRESNKEEIDDIILLINEFAEFIDKTEGDSTDNKMFSSELSIDKESMIDAFFESKKAVHLFIEINGEKVGYLVYYNLFSTFTGKLGLYLEDLYVKEVFRGNGIGKKAFNYLKFIAKRDNYCKIEWNCLRNNDSALRFYEEELAATNMDELKFFELKKYD